MNQVKTLSLLSLLSGLLVLIGWVLGGQSGALIGLAFAAATNLWSWYFSDKIALSAYGAQPVSAEEAPELHQMVQRLADRAGIPMPAVYVVPSSAANAFATGRDPNHAAVAVTQGIVSMLTPDELEGVIAHELSHVRNRDTLTQAVAATVAGAISYLAQMASYSMWFGGMSRDEDNRGGNPLGLLFAVILAPMAASIIQMSISRTREFEADAGAAQLTGQPAALASALQKLQSGSERMPLEANPSFSPLLIINNLSGQGFANLFSTHPSTEERIQRLLQMQQEMLTTAGSPTGTTFLKS
jgi:heat shock protein HtpX